MDAQGAVNVQVDVLIVTLTLASETPERTGTPQKIVSG